MHFSMSRRSAIVPTLLAAALLAGCPALRPEAPVQPPAALPPVQPVEAEPVAPATQPGGVLAASPQEPVNIMLAYADRIRPSSASELANEIARLGKLDETPATQMQTALALAQTRNPPDVARAQSLLQKVIANPSAEAQPLQPLARALAARLAEQRRIEDDRDKQTQALRDAQRRIDQLNERIEALRAIERSVTRPASPLAAPPQPKPAP
jgi:hypothetical protein